MIGGTPVSLLWPFVHTHTCVFYLSHIQKLPALPSTPAWDASNSEGEGSGVSVLPLTPRDAVIFSHANRCLSPTYQLEFMMQGSPWRRQMQSFPRKEIRGLPKCLQESVHVSSQRVLTWWDGGIYSCLQLATLEGEFSATTARCKRNTKFRGPNESSLFLNSPLIYLLPWGNHLTSHGPLTSHLQNLRNWSKWALFIMVQFSIIKPKTCPYFLKNFNL